jgi:hypothetical protein
MHAFLLVLSLCFGRGPAEDAILNISECSHDLHQSRYSAIERYIESLLPAISGRTAYRKADIPSGSQRTHCHIRSRCRQVAVPVAAKNAAPALKNLMPPRPELFWIAKWRNMNNKYRNAGMGPGVWKPL